MIDEREEWQALIDTPGFQRLTKWAKADLEQHMLNAANTVEDTAALNTLRQVIAAKRAVERVLGYPSDRLKALKHAEVSMLVQSRGGL